MDEIALILYGTSGCHLCDEALQEIKSALAQNRSEKTISLLELDITDDDTLYDLYETSIPVLKIESRQTSTVLNWPFNAQKVYEILFSL